MNYPYKLENFCDFSEKLNSNKNPEQYLSRNNPDLSLNSKSAKIALIWTGMYYWLTLSLLWCYMQLIQVKSLDTIDWTYIYHNVNTWLFWVFCWNAEIWFRGQI